MKDIILEQLKEEENKIIERINNLKSRLNEEEKKKQDVKRRIGEHLHEIRVGDIVKYQGKEFIVRTIDYRCLKPWVDGSPRNKDGTWSNKVIHLYSEWNYIAK